MLKGWPTERKLAAGYTDSATQDPRTDASVWNDSCSAGLPWSRPASYGKAILQQGLLDLILY